MSLKEALKILELDGATTPEDIRQAFRRMAFRYHPDRYQTFSRKAWATRHFIKIKEAHDLLISSSSFSDKFAEQGAEGFQGEEDFRAYTEAEDSEVEHKDSHSSYSFFDWLINKIPSSDNPWSIILDIFILPLMIIFIPYTFVIRILQSILEKFGLEPEPGQFTFLVISTIGALVYLPIFYWAAFTGTGDTSPTTFHIVLGLALSAGVVLFVLSEWISFVLTKIWSRSIQSELKKFLPVARKRTNESRGSQLP